MVPPPQASTFFGCYWYLWSFIDTLELVKKECVFDALSTWEGTIYIYVYIYIRIDDVMKESKAPPVLIED